MAEQKTKQQQQQKKAGFLVCYIYKNMQLR